MARGWHLSRDSALSHVRHLGGSRRCPGFGVARRLTVRPSLAGCGGPKTSVAAQVRIETSRTATTSGLTRGGPNTSRQSHSACHSLLPREDSERNQLTLAIRSRYRGLSTMPAYSGSPSRQWSRPVRCRPRYPLSDSNEGFRTESQLRTQNGSVFQGKTASSLPMYRPELPPMGVATPAHLALSKCRFSLDRQLLLPKRFTLSLTASQSRPSPSHPFASARVSWSLESPRWLVRG